MAERKLANTLLIPEQVQLLKSKHVKKYSPSSGVLLPRVPMLHTAAKLVLHQLGYLVDLVPG